MNKLKRFYIFTGKGGVGKSTLATSFVRYLQSQKRKCSLVYFETSSLDQTKQTPTFYKDIQKDNYIELLPLNLFDCTVEYVGKKLKSQTIASWVLKAPFFQALINMIPGLNYLIFLGKCLDLLDKDPDLILVLDSPSSGHAMTMLQTLHNFSEIFQSGLLFDDTKRMAQLLASADFCHLHIITLTSTLAMTEAQELKQKVSELKLGINISTTVNCSLTKVEDINPDTVPPFLNEKMKLERKALEDASGFYQCIIPYATATQNKEIANQIVPLMKNLV